MNGLLLGIVAVALALGGSAHGKANQGPTTAVTNPHSFVPVSASYAPSPGLLKALHDAFSDNTHKVVASYNGTSFSVTKLSDAPYEVANLDILKQETAVKLGYLSASIDISNANATLVESWRKFIPVSVNIESSGPHGPVVLQVGFAIEMVSHISDFKGGINLGNIIKSITASASYSNLHAVSHTEVLGLSSRSITEQIPTASDLLKAQSGKSTIPEVIAEKFKGIKDQAWSVGSGGEAGLTPVIVGIRDADVDYLNSLP